MVHEFERCAKAGIARLLRAGIVHGDFNEFNLMLDKAKGMGVCYGLMLDTHDL